MFNRLLKLAALPILAGAILAGACGDDETSTPGGDASQDGGAGVSTVGMVDPNARLTYGGKTYQLTGVELDDLFDDSGLAKVGESTSSSVDTGSEVFARPGADDTVFTRSADGDSRIWLRWQLA
ncbi:MAG: hypothetical protein IH609_13915 [Dehalococcoidia bacterium]|nr:hypothetical protein [Dehalococcoidia bacterium]